MKRIWPVFFVFSLIIIEGFWPAHSDPSSTSAPLSLSKDDNVEVSIDLDSQKDYRKEEHLLYSTIVPTFYFYNTESNFNNFAAVKMSFDIYFVDHGGYFLQPFDLLRNFEKSITGKKGDIYLYFTRSRLRIFQIAGILGLKVF